MTRRSFCDPGCLDLLTHQTRPTLSQHNRSGGVDLTGVPTIPGDIAETLRHWEQLTDADQQRAARCIEEAGREIQRRHYAKRAETKTEETEAEEFDD